MNAELEMMSQDCRGQSVFVWGLVEIETEYLLATSQANFTYTNLLGLTAILSPC